MDWTLETALLFEFDKHIFKIIVYRNAWFGNTITVFVIKQIC